MKVTTITLNVLIHSFAKSVLNIKIKFKKGLLEEGLIGICKLNQKSILTSRGVTVNESRISKLL